jgi:predicted RecA/RadA family phage recombinase
MSIIAVVTKPIGQTVAYTPTTNLAKGDVVVVGPSIAVVMNADIAANTEGQIQPCGVVSLPKSTAALSGAALAFGTQCFWDATNLRVSSDPTVGVRAGIVVTQGAADTDTSVNVFVVPNARGNPEKFTTDAIGSQTLPAGAFTGADSVVWKNTANGAVALTMRTATQMFSDFPGATVGGTYRLRVISAGNNTVTITAGGGFTAADTMTVATLTWRDYDITFNTATTATMRCVGAGTFS